MIFEEFENLKILTRKFIGLSPEFPEDEALAFQIGTSLGKLQGLIQELSEESNERIHSRSKQ
jgi:hypothetical protein